MFSFIFLLSFYMISHPSSLLLKKKYSRRRRNVYFISFAVAVADKVHQVPLLTVRQAYRDPQRDSSSKRIDYSTWKQLQIPQCALSQEKLHQEKDCKEEKNMRRAIIEEKRRRREEEEKKKRTERRAKRKQEYQRASRGAEKRTETKDHYASGVKELNNFRIWSAFNCKKTKQQKKKKTTKVSTFVVKSDSFSIT